jgi:hypothetical protein
MPTGYVPTQEDIDGAKAELLQSTPTASVSGYVPSADDIAQAKAALQPHAPTVSGYVPTASDIAQAKSALTATPKAPVTYITNNAGQRIPVSPPTAKTSPVAGDDDGFSTPWTPPTPGPEPFMERVQNAVGNFVKPIDDFVQQQAEIAGGLQGAVGDVAHAVIQPIARAVDASSPAAALLRRYGSTAPNATPLQRFAADPAGTIAEDAVTLPTGVVWGTNQLAGQLMPSKLQNGGWKNLASSMGPVPEALGDLLGNRVAVLTGQESPSQFAEAEGGIYSKLLTKDLPSHPVSTVASALPFAALHDIIGGAKAIPTEPSEATRPIAANAPTAPDMEANAEPVATPHAQPAQPWRAVEAYPGMSTNGQYHVMRTDTGAYALHGPGGALSEHATPEEAQAAVPGRATEPAETPEAAPSAPSFVSTAPHGSPLILHSTQEVADAFGAAQPDFTPDHVAAIKALLDAQAEDWSRSTGKPVEDFAPAVYGSVIKGEKPTIRVGSRTGQVIGDNADTLGQSAPYNVDDLGFYSQAERVIQAKMGGKASAQQIRGMLQSNGVKPDEMQWSGLNDFLDENGNRGITKQEVLDHLTQNNVRLKEVEKNGIDTTYGQYQLPGGSNYREALLTSPRGRAEANATRAYQAFREEMNTKYGHVEYGDAKMTPIERVKYGRIVDDIERARNEDNRNVYHSSHWDEPNVLAHVRMSDRVGPNGEKILHVEEVQSDWHQQGRKEGYNTTDPRKPWEVFNVSDGKPVANFATKAEAKAYSESIHGKDGQYYDYDNGLNSIVGNKAKVPNAPFSKSWHELAAKRILRYASEHGYDKVAWTKGAEQAERYDLSKQVDKITYDPATQKLEVFKGKNPIMSEVVAPDKIGNHVGEELSKKLLNAPRKVYGSQGADINEYENLKNEQSNPAIIQALQESIDRIKASQASGGQHELEGTDLKVGGEGMKGFYDKILPDTFSKIGKRFGAKVGETTVPMRGGYNWVDKSDHVPLHSIDITPEMRKSLTTEGQPLFQRTGALKGSVTFDPADARATVRMFKASDISTAVHEIAHVWRRHLAEPLRKALEDYYGVKNGAWERSHEEHFAESFEKYLADGKAPKPSLQQAFDNFKAWLTKIYAGIKGSPLDRELAPELRAVFDKMLGGDDAEAAGARTPRVKPEYQRSVNLDRMGLDDAGKQAIRDADREIADNSAYPEKLNPVKVQRGADALGLTPDFVAQWFKDNPDGRVPEGVHPALFTKAVADQAKQAADRVSAASRTYQDEPTDANAKALTDAQEDVKKVLPALQTLRRLPGQTMWSFNMEASPLSEALQRAQERKRALAEVPKQPAVTFNTPKTKRTFTAAKRQAALDALNQSKPLEQRATTDTNTLHQIGNDPTRVQHLTNIGGFHYEEGAKDFDKWSAKMEADVPSMDDEDLTRIYSNVKAEIAKNRNPNLKARADLSFGDELALRIGRQKANDLINTLAADYPGALQKILDGNEKALTPAERDAAADLMHAAQNRSVKTRPTNAAVRVLKEITDQVHPPSQARAVRNTLEAAVKQRIGAKGWASLQTRATIDTDLSSALGKLDRGQADTLTDAEKRAFTTNLDDLRTKPTKGGGTPVSKQLTEMARQARAGEIGFSDSESLVRHLLTEELEEHPSRLAAALADIATVKPGDLHDLANKYNQWSTLPATSREGFATKAKYAIRSGLLSGPRTLGQIVLGHGIGSAFEEGVVNPATALATRGKYANAHPSDALAGLKAGAKAVPESGRIIKEGVTAHELRGAQPYNRPADLGHGLTKEPIANAGVRSPLRFHAAVFHVFGKMAETTALYRTARLWARRFGGDYTQYLNDPDVKDAAHKFAAEMIYQNPNAVAEGINSGLKAIDKRVGAPVAQTAGAVEAPFRATPLNILGRGLEYSGAGVPAAATRYALSGGGKYLWENGKKVMMSDNDQFLFKQGLARQAVRGVVGPAALGTLGYALAKAGILNPPNQSKYEYGSINFHGKRYDINRLAPVATPVELGGELYLYLRGKDADFLAPFTDSPFSTISEQAHDIQEGAKNGGKKFSAEAAKIMGGIFSTFVPTIFSQIAGATDPSGMIRVKKGVLDAIMNRIPWLREHLKASRYPQANNYKSTGLPSVFAPVGVEKGVGYNARR